MSGGSIEKVTVRYNLQGGERSGYYGGVAVQNYTRRFCEYTTETLTNQQVSRLGRPRVTYLIGHMDETGQSTSKHLCVGRQAG